MNFETLIVAFGALVSLVFYFKRQADEAKKNAVLGETKGEDKVLRENQEEVKKEIQDSDARIKQFYEEREKLKNLHESREDRADKWNK